MCPPGLTYPFFAHETRQKINIYGCCLTCIKEKRQTRCPQKHSDEKRGLTFVTTVPEYLYSLTLGYELVCIHEALLYTESDYIFRTYINFLAREKIRFSKIPANETAMSYADRINISLQLSGTWKLDENSFQYNNQFRNLCKLFLNTIAGKLIQTEDNFQTILVHCQGELEKLFWEKRIEYLEAATPEIMQVVIKTNQKKANRSRNVVIGAYVLGLSKIKMSQAIHAVAKSGGIPMYSDTGKLHLLCDSVFHLFLTNSVTTRYRQFGCKNGRKVFFPKKCVTFFSTNAIYKVRHMTMGYFFEIF